MGDKEKKYVHMLNATLCATGRAICCLLETYQEANGVRIPDVLVPYMGGITFLPFVRESRTGAGTPAVSVKPTPAAAPVAAAASAAPAAASAAPAVELTAEGEELRKAVENKATEIRDKKAAKAGKEEIQELVNQLLALKAQFSEKTGYNFGPPMTPIAPPAAPSNAPAATAATAAPKVEAAPAVPKAPPASVMEAVPRRTRISLPTPSSVWKQEVVDLVRLEEQLKTHSFVVGFQPSAEDIR
jgi:hypothetical protein